MITSERPNNLIMIRSLNSDHSWVIKNISTKIWVRIWDNCVYYLRRSVGANCHMIPTWIWKIRFLCQMKLRILYPSKLWRHHHVVDTCMGHIEISHLTFHLRPLHLPLDGPNTNKQSRHYVLSLKYIAFNTFYSLCSLTFGH